MEPREIPSDYIGGRFVEPKGERLVSIDPAHDGRPVVAIRWTPERVDEAIQAAHEAFAGWSSRSMAERWEFLVRFRKAIEAKKEALADAIVREIGKIRSEARAEVQSLIARFDLVLQAVKRDLREGPLPGFPSEALRWHPHGVVGVIGPFNFPLHLCHVHVVPALLLGNTVVVKPSELSPLCGIRYAEAAHEAGFPPGVFNLIHGRAQSGAALVGHPLLRALAFTGSWPVGRKIMEALLDRPEVLVALEMGGKNTAVVCEDAEIRQAAHEIVVGSYLTTGQRCTCTDRVLVHASKAKALIDALLPLVQNLRFGDPDDPRAFAGPLASEAGLIKLERAIQACEAAGGEPIVRGERLPGGFYRTASFHLLPRGVHEVPGYTDVELFGPDFGIEIVEDDGEAIAVLNASPYGFATSVFTASDARFERYYRETRVGILNRNRSTNQASPRLPFGGVGRSGNFRPAGSFAPRNLAIPVAVQSNAVGVVPTLALLQPDLPPPDLDLIESMHVLEEAEEAKRSLIDGPRPPKPQKPKLEGPERLPQSTGWIERLSAGERVVREKKLPVFDHLRSRGGLYVSIDDEPLVVLDAMSQTATLPFGFNDDALVRAYVDGVFGDAMLRGRSILHGEGKAVAEGYAQSLRALVPGLPHVSFASCGAEANEKAIALCHRERPGAKRLLAFEGSFHGRTLLALHASYSPAKRLPFEIPGYEVAFAPFPIWTEPDPVGPPDPPGWRECMAGADIEAFEAKTRDIDPLLRAEIESLRFVRDRLRAEPHIAVIVEPMQSEGGDRYATPRFFRALRLLTRALGVPLIVDEVQCGFGLGGPFAWHSLWKLVDRDGNPDWPDCVVFAKRAQVGVVLSRFEDPEPTQAFVTSLIRGNIHAKLISEREGDAERIERLVRKGLERIAQRFPFFVLHPRAQGFAFAFDLPTPAHLTNHLASRFSRGAIVFGAGERTVRYRLHGGMSEEDIAFLFGTIEQTLALLEAKGWAHGEGARVEEWDDLPLPPYGLSRPKRPSVDGEVVIRRARAEEKERLLGEILALEARVYEPARRDPPERLALGFDDPDGIVVVALDAKTQERLLGYAIACPLERVKDMEGPDRDPHLGREDSAYTVALTVAPEAQGLAIDGLGLGSRLKEALLREARALTKADGSPRYLWMVGRNRIGAADAMIRINDRFGAFTVSVLEGQYGEPDARARYYRQPLRGIRAREIRMPQGPIDLARGVVAPFEGPLASLVQAEASGLLYGPTVNKITLCNYVTPAIVRAVEEVAVLTPNLPHLFFTSGRDETVDKSFRILRWHRKEGRFALSLEGTYVGHTTALARSISDPSTHRQGPPYFDVLRVPHPARVGGEAFLQSLFEAVERAGGAQRVVGLYAEPVGERTGLVLSEEAILALSRFRKETGIPIVFVETSSAYYRSGRGPFASSPWVKREALSGAEPFTPDLLLWWTGGQHGHVHVASHFFVGTPLTFVSTWDGDELSMIQAMHFLRAARRIDVKGLIQRFERALACVERAFPTQGLGLHRLICAQGHENAILSALSQRGLWSQSHPNGTIPLIPPLDRVEEVSQALEDIDWLALKGG
ncbi:MAG: aldehyde dehydrogenase family protein [Sandaracinaceae bacterium]|nr:aldehyde dehydrogenase family protein [Sandaracinaceae bacterium]